MPLDPSRYASLTFGEARKLAPDDPYWAWYRARLFARPEYTQEMYAFDMRLAHHNDETYGDNL